MARRARKLTSCGQASALCSPRSIRGADMSADMEGEDLELLAHFTRRPTATLNGRRARETRPLARNDRQRISTRPCRDCQLNLKVTSEFHARVSALARNARLSLPDLIERAVESYAEQQEKA